jgi:ribosomal protein L16/L10AE
MLQWAYRSKHHQPVFTIQCAKTQPLMDEARRALTVSAAKLGMERFIQTRDDHAYGKTIPDP